MRPHFPIEYELPAALDSEIDLGEHLSDGLEPGGSGCDATRCGDGDPCTRDLCSDAGCAHEPVPDGAQCDDGNPGTVHDMCWGGECVGEVPECLADADCDDGDACNGPESCDGLICRRGPPPDCEAESACTSAACDRDLGCVTRPLPDGTRCDDGEFCTVGEVCTLGLCGGGAPRDCTALGDSCTVGVCNEEHDSCWARPANEAQACDDGDPCSTDERCHDGVCGGGAPAGDATAAAQCGGRRR